MLTAQFSLKAKICQSDPILIEFKPVMGGRRPDMPNKVPVFSHLIVYCNYDNIQILSQIEPCNSNDISPLLWGG